MTTPHEHLIDGDGRLFWCSAPGCDWIYAADAVDDPDVGRDYEAAHVDCPCGRDYMRVTLS